MQDDEILALSIARLVAAQVEGRLKAVQILAAYRRRAEVIDRACNAITCAVPEAEAWAAACDAFIAAHGAPMGPLHGVPCSIKDHYAMKGLPSTMGERAIQRAQRKKGGMRQDSLAVLALQRAGAVPFCKTAMSQRGQTWGGGSPVHGDTLNPWDTLRTAGGSSAGEGALVGAGGSVFGLGSDTGGSIRVPAAFQGLAGIKPGPERCPFDFDDGRRVLSHPGDYGVVASGGPMARRVSDLVEVCRGLWSASTSPLLAPGRRHPPVAFDEAALARTGPLTVGYSACGGCSLVPPCPATARVLSRAAAALRKAGHLVVPFDFSAAVPREKVAALAAALDGIDSTISEADPAATAAVAVSGEESSEPPHPDLAPMYECVIRARRLAPELPDVSSVASYRLLMAERDRIRDRFDAAVRKAGVDVLLCPAFPFPAPYVENVAPLAEAIRATHVFNVLDVPAGVVPAGRVTAADLQRPWPLGDAAEPVAAAVRALRVGSEGLPLAVQLVAPPWRDETLLRAMLELEAALCAERHDSGQEQDDLFDPDRTHHRLRPIPRRSASLGARPMAVTARDGRSRL